MKRVKLGVCLESLGLALRPALLQCARMGVTGVQLNAVGDLGPNQLSGTGRRELMHLLKSHNLDLIALGCPLRAGLDIPEGLDTRLELVRRVMALSYDLGARLIVIQAGRIPDDPAHPAAGFLTESLLALGQHGDRSGCRVALETGLEKGATMAAFLDRLDSGSLAALFDPANLIMNGHDAFASARELGHRIAACHAKDVRRATASRVAQEVPLGHGDIDWMAFLALLEEIDFRGWLAIERESGEHRVDDVAGGVKFLRRLMPTE